MLSEEGQMIGRSMDTETMGYAYVYLKENRAREEYLVTLKEENPAGLIGEKGLDAPKNIVTDVLDRLIVGTSLGMLATCANQRLCGDFHPSSDTDPVGGKGSRGDFDSRPGGNKRIFCKSNKDNTKIVHVNRELIVHLNYKVIMIKFMEV